MSIYEDRFGWTSISSFDDGDEPKDWTSIADYKAATPEYNAFYK